MSQQTDSESRRDVSMLGVTRRMIYSLALIPIVPAVAFVAESCCKQYLLPPNADAGRWFDLIFSALTVFCMILIWRAAIVWTLGREMLTGLVSMIPFVQVIYAKPLWNAGCIREDYLRAGQEQFGIAVWIWLLVWVWWAWERIIDRANARPSRPWRMRMNPRMRAVVASIGTIPFAVAVCFVFGVAYDNLLGVPAPYLGPATYLTGAVFAVAAWLVVWRKNVRWSGIVLRQTLVSAALLIGVPAIGTGLCEQVRSELLKILLTALPSIGWGIWMATTMWLWPFAASGADVTAASPRCLKCGYLLKGLTHTRCPECGDERTLDELWTAGAAET